MQELPAPAGASEAQKADDGTVEEKKWIMKAVKSASSSPSDLRQWVIESWTSFLDLLKVSVVALVTLHVLTVCRTPKRSTSSSWR